MKKCKTCRREKYTMLNFDYCFGCRGVREFIFLLLMAVGCRADTITNTTLNLGGASHITIKAIYENQNITLDPNSYNTVEVIGYALSKIKTEVVTNWTTVEVQREPICKDPSCLVAHVYTNLEFQLGKLETNICVEVVYQGKTNTFQLEKVAEQWPSRIRTNAVAVNPILIYNSARFTYASNTIDVISKP